MNELRKCAGKPDGTPCSAPAVRGDDYCRHHRPRPVSPLPPLGPAELVLVLSAEELRAPVPDDPEADAIVAAWMAAGNPQVEQVLKDAFAGKRPFPEATNGPRPSLIEDTFLRELRRQGVDEETLKAVQPGDIDRRFRRLQAQKAEWLSDQIRQHGEVRIRVQVVPSDAVGPGGEPAPHPVQLDGLAEAPNSPADRDLHLSLALKDPDVWPLNSDEGHRYYEGKEATVIYRPNELFGENWWANDLRENTLRLLDRRFSEMRGDLVADIADLLFLHWLANGRPAKARITLAQVLNYRGVKPERKTLELHWRAMRDARSIRLRDATIDAALFEMDSVRTAQGNLFAFDDPPSADVIYAYSPGAFVGAAVSQNSAYLAAYTPRFLSLDPHNYSMAKRLARYLRGEWRMNPEGYLPSGQRRYRTWREHLADAGVEPSERFEQRQTEFLDALDQQLTELREVNGIGGWTPNLHRRGSVDDNTWERIADLYHPQDRKLLRSLPYRNRLEVFRSLRVHLPPPGDLTDNLTHYLRLRAARAAQRQAIAQETAVRRAARAQAKPAD